MADQNREEEIYDDWENSDFEPNSFGVNENGNGQGMASGTQIPRQEQRGSLPPISSLSNLSPQNQGSGKSGRFDDFGPPILSREVVLSQEVVSPQYQMERQDFQRQSQDFQGQSQDFQGQNLASGQRYGQNFQGQNFQAQYYGQRYSQVLVGEQGNLPHRQENQGGDLDPEKTPIRGQENLVFEENLAPEQTPIRGQENHGQNLSPEQRYSQSSIRGQGNLVSGPNLATRLVSLYRQGNQGQNLAPRQENLISGQTYLSPEMSYPNSKIPQYQQRHISPPTSNNVPFFSGYFPQGQNNIQGFVPNNPYAQVSKNAGSQISYSVAPKSVGPQMSKSVGPQFPNPHNFPQQYGKVSPPILTKQFSGHPLPLMFQNQLVCNNLNPGASSVQQGPGKTLKKPRKSPLSKTPTSPEKRARNRIATRKSRELQLEKFAMLLSKCGLGKQFVKKFLACLFYQYFNMTQLPQILTEMIDFVFDTSFVGSAGKHTGVKEKRDEQMYWWQLQAYENFKAMTEEKLNPLPDDGYGFKFLMKNCMDQVKMQEIDWLVNGEKKEEKNVQSKQSEAKQEEAKKRGRKPKNVNK